MDQPNGLHTTLMPADMNNGTAVTTIRHKPANLMQSAAKALEKRFSGSKQLPVIHEQQWLKTAEQATFWGSVVATLMVAVSQQAVFAVPLSLCFGLNLVNRQRWEQQIQQRLTTAMTEVAQVRTDLQNQSNHPLAVEFKSLQQRLERLEKADWQQPVTALQQWVRDIDVSAEALHDRTRNLDKLYAQVEYLQQWVESQTKSDRGRVAIFIDGANLSKAAQKLGIEIDYTKLLAWLTADSPLFRAFFYMRVDSANNLQQNLLSSLRCQGYRVVSKEVVRRDNGSTKANLDVEIALDLVSLVGVYDTAVLVSGNDDLACALKAVSSQGARVEVVSLQSWNYEDLIDVADCYIDLEAIKDKIRKSADKHFLH